MTRGCENDDTRTHGDGPQRSAADTAFSSNKAEAGLGSVALNPVFGSCVHSVHCGSDRSTVLIEPGMNREAQQGRAVR